MESSRIIHAGPRDFTPAGIRKLFPPPRKLVRYPLHHRRKQFLLHKYAMSNSATCSASQLLPHDRICTPKTLSGYHLCLATSHGRFFSFGWRDPKDKLSTILLQTLYNMHTASQLQRTWQPVQQAFKLNTLVLAHWILEYACPCISTGIRLTWVSFHPVCFK